MLFFPQRFLFATLHRRENLDEPGYQMGLSVKSLDLSILRVRAENELLGGAAGVGVHECGTPLIAIDRPAPAVNLDRRAVRRRGAV